MITENKNTRGILIISFFVSVLSAYCALMGFCDKSLYGDVISTGVFKMSFMAGTISQDIITIASSVLMMILIALYGKSKDIRIIICITGLLSFYLYGYGTYVISALYTSLYIVYMIIFTLSLFGLVMGISGFTSDIVKNLYLPNWLRISGSAFLSLIVFIFMGKWIADIIPYTQTHTAPDFYAIYILDLCIVMPFFIITIYMLIKKAKSAYILLGIALVKTTTLMLSVSIGSFIAPAYGTQDELSMIIIYCSVAVISFLLFMFYCLKFKSRLD